MFRLHRFSLLVLWRGLTFLDLGDLLGKGFNLTLFYLDHFSTVIVGHIQAQFFDGFRPGCTQVGHPRCGHDVCLPQFSQDVPILLHNILLFLLSFWSFYTSKKLVGFYLANLTMMLILEIFWKCAQVKTAPLNTAGL